jgi:phosphoglycolate phosphatase-like HAD superfamily hydrolase
VSREVERLRELKAVAADLDDTAVRTGHKIKKYHQAALGLLAISPMPSDREIDRLVGGPSAVVFEGLYPTDEIEEAKRIFAEKAGTDPHPSERIPGVPEALARLASLGVLYGVATNRKRQTEAAIRGGGLDRDEMAFVYDGNYGLKSEALKAILQLEKLQKLGIGAINLAMMGDTDRDMFDANKADADILKVGILKYAADPRALKRVSDIHFGEVPDFVDALAEAKRTR